MPKSAYEDLILALLDEKDLHIECTEDLNLLSFRSAFYRFRETDIGRMLIGDLQLKIFTYYEDEVKLAHLSVASPKKLEFKIRSKPNASV